MWKKKVIEWIATVFWPLIRDQVLPMIWEFVKKNAEQMLFWLWGKVKERFEAHAEETKRHARQQEEHAKAQAEKAQDAAVAEHWKQAADYWRHEYERTEELLQQTLAQTMNDFAGASSNFHDTIDETPVELVFGADSIRASMGDVHRKLEPPKE